MRDSYENGNRYEAGERTGGNRYEAGERTSGNRCESGDRTGNGGEAWDGEAVRLLRQLAEGQREAVAAQKKSLRAARLSLLLWVVTAAALAALVPHALRTLRQAEAALDGAASLAETLETASGSAGKAMEAMERIGEALDGEAGEALEGLLSGDSLADGVRNFQEGMESFRTAMNKLNAIDFDALNQAVRDISEVASPLRGLLGR